MWNPDPEREDLVERADVCGCIPYPIAQYINTVMALPLDDPLVHVVQWNPTTINVTLRWALWLDLSND
jgi:hypothetical protein